MKRKRKTDWKWLFFFYNQKAEVKHEETILCITEIGVTMWKAARLSITALKC